MNIKSQCFLSDGSLRAYDQHWASQIYTSHMLPWPAGLDTSSFNVIQPQTMLHVAKQPKINFLLSMMSLLNLALNSPANLTPVGTRMVSDFFQGLKPLKVSGLMV